MNRLQFASRVYTRGVQRVLIRTSQVGVLSLLADSIFGALIFRLNMNNIQMNGTLTLSVVKVFKNFLQFTFLIRELENVNS